MKVRLFSKHCCNFYVVGIVVVITQILTSFIYIYIYQEFLEENKQTAELKTSRIELQKFKKFKNGLD